jgi:2',3'-cyclic-nucleotide 2'-phosphodiesterase (5'-nucleotidase family)
MGDLELAQEVDGIDMIVGGNTRRFMKRGKKVRKSDDSTTVVSQAGYGGAMVGQTSFSFSGQNWLRNIFSSNHVLDSETE